MQPKYQNRPAPSPRDVLAGIRRATISRTSEADAFAAVLLANEHEHRSFEALRETWRSAGEEGEQ